MSIQLPPSLDPTDRMPSEYMSELLSIRDGYRIELPVSLSYIFIVFTQRSGSFYLADLLASTGYFNHAQEALTPAAVTGECARKGWKSYSEYFFSLSAIEAKNKQFVVKTTIEQLTMLTWYGVLPRISRRARFLVIERMDKLGQAISWYIANQTGYFQSNYPPPVKTVPVYKRQQIAHNIEIIQERERQTKQFMAFNEIRPHRVYYEQLVADPISTSRFIAEYLQMQGLQFDLSKISSQRMATDVNAAWRERFLAETTEAIAKELTGT